MEICVDCAKRLGFVPKDKAVGVWKSKCAYCGQVKEVCDDENDYYPPKETKKYPLNVPKKLHYPSFRKATGKEPETQKLVHELLEHVIKNGGWF